MDCTLDNINNSSNSCEFVKQYCDDYEIINLKLISYCYINQYFFIVVLLFLLFFGFDILSRVADNFLSSSLKKISQLLRFSQTLSAVTLLAFANGAPDVITALFAGNVEGGTYISAAGLAGAMAFSFNIVVANCFYKSSKTKHLLEKKIYYKDAVFILLFIFLIFTIGFFGVNYISIILLILSYVCYIILTIRLDNNNEKNNEDELNLSEQLSDDNDVSIDKNKLLKVDAFIFEYFTKHIKQNFKNFYRQFSIEEKNKMIDNIIEEKDILEKYSFRRKIVAYLKSLKDTENNYKNSNNIFLKGANFIYYLYSYVIDLMLSLIIPYNENILLNIFPMIIIFFWTLTFLFFFECIIISTKYLFIINHICNFKFYLLSNKDL